MPRKIRDEQGGLPLPMSDVSNGEWCPRPPTAQQTLAARLLTEEADRRSRRLGLTRAQFLRTAAGTLTAFWVLNRVHGLPSRGDAAVLPIADVHCQDLGAADDYLRDQYFIVDVQTHHVDVAAFPGAASALCFLRFLETNLSCAERYQHLSQTNFVKELFVDSQTDVAVISGVPGGTILPVQTMAATRDVVNGLAGSERTLIQAMIDPAAPSGYQTALDSLDQQVQANGARAIKCYTGTSAPGGQWRMDDESIAYPMFEKARQLGIKLINVHKGLPGLGGNDPMYVATDDLPKAIRDFPDLKFCAYHSGYFPTDAGYGQGIDGFIQMAESLKTKDRRRLYAEIGSTFALTFQQSPEAAAHLLGRLLKTLRSRNVLWGTDSIWWGSPQWQIDAFKSLVIPASMQHEFGYPALTTSVKKRILGLNAARLYGLAPRAVRCAISADQLSAVQQEQGGVRAARSLRTYGPRTRREFLTLLTYQSRLAPA
jgi:predicted TIM-barrel fold metal-dependent hydrolase